MVVLLLAPLLAAMVLGVAASGLWVQRRHQEHLVGTVGAAADGRFDILYFTGESCTVCHVAQRPALARLVAGDGDVAIREVDIAAEPDVARRYRVMTLPTTIVLDDEGRVAAVNVGFATESVLREQLDGARRGSEQAAIA